jgi:hypothetical protein
VAGHQRPAVDDEPVPDEAAWASRAWLARGLRAITYLAPVAASALAIFFAVRLVSEPSGAGRFLWFGGLLLVGSVVSLVAHRVMQRLLPLALLLEMSLCFPESAPSRLRLSRRSNSVSELKLLMLAPRNETAQQAAERMLKLLAALQAHDRHTRGHAERVRAYADLIAETMGMTARDRDRLKWAALLHDIGKLHVPVSLLNKPSSPDDAEWEILRGHPAAGDQLASALREWLAPMDRVILEHHERWDGSGYPSGKVGREVSEGSRIVQVADAFEVMTAARAYKRPVRREAALRELVRCAGSQFDPAVVRALVAVPNRWLLWAAGPTAWLAQVPLLGQNTATLLSAAANQISTVAVSAAAGATIATAAAIAPVAAATSAVPPTQQTQIVETGASIAAPALPSTPATAALAAIPMPRTPASSAPVASGSPAAASPAPSAGANPPGSPASPVASPVSGLSGGGTGGSTAGGSVANGNNGGNGNANGAGNGVGNGNGNNKHAEPTNAPSGSVSTTAPKASHTPKK